MTPPRIALALALLLGAGAFVAPQALAGPSPAQVAYAQADAALNRAWPAAMAAAKRRKVDAKLRAAQLAWVAFKDAEAKAMALQMSPGLATDWLAAETRDRTDFLKQVALGPIPEGSPNEEGFSTTAQYFAREDRRLNEVWRGMLASPAWKPAGVRPARTTAQLAWIRYRDAQAAYVHADGGSDLAWVKGYLTARRCEGLGD